MDYVVRSKRRSWRYLVSSIRKLYRDDELRHDTCWDKGDWAASYGAQSVPSDALHTLSSAWPRNSGHSLRSDQSSSGTVGPHSSRSDLSLDIPAPDVDFMLNMIDMTNRTRKTKSASAKESPFCGRCSGSMNKKHSR